ADRIDDRLGARAVLFGRDRRREPAAELLRPGEKINAGAAGGAADDVGLERMQAEAVDVEERHRPAGRQSRELQEGAIDIGDRIAAGVDAVARGPLNARARI